MGSLTPEAMCPTNSLARRARKTDAVGRLTARSEQFLWLFGQIHAKRFLVFMHLIMLGLSIWMLWEVAAAEFTGLPLVGLDGTSPFERQDQIQRDFQAKRQSDIVHVSTNTGVSKPFLYLARNVASSLGYFYILSVIIGLTAIRAVDGVWQHGGVSPLFFVNPALFLIPFLLSVLSVGVLLFLWTVKNGKMQFYDVEINAANGYSLLVVFDVIRFFLLPCILMWLLFSYFFYGCVLGFIYTYRRAEQWRSQKNGTSAASLSWSFRAPSDRPAVIQRFREHSLKKSGLFSRMNAANRSWHSYKNIDNPTLRGYTKKSDDDGWPSWMSEEISFGSECSDNNNLNRSFCSFDVSRRQLEPVEEEVESQESTLVSSHTAGPSKKTTRM